MRVEEQRVVFTVELNCFALWVCRSRVDCRVTAAEAKAGFSGEGVRNVQAINESLRAAKSWTQRLAVA